MGVINRETIANHFKQAQYPLTNLGTEQKPRYYLEVKYRINALRALFPDATIETHTIPLTNAALGHARVTPDPINNPTVFAEGDAMHSATAVAKDYVANASTSAIGRALAALGIGTVEALEDFDEDRDGQGAVIQPAEAPVAPRQQPTRPQTPRPTTAPAASPVANPATERQVKAIRAMAMGEFNDWEQVSKWHGDQTRITFEEARTVLDYLNSRKVVGLTGTGEIEDFDLASGRRKLSDDELPF